MSEADFQRLDVSNSVIVAMSQLLDVQVNVVSMSIPFTLLWVIFKVNNCNLQRRIDAFHNVLVQLLESVQITKPRVTEHNLLAFFQQLAQHYLACCQEQRVVEDIEVLVIEVGFAKCCFATRR